MPFWRDISVPRRVVIYPPPWALRLVSQVVEISREQLPEPPGCLGAQRGGSANCGRKNCGRTSGASERNRGEVNSHIRPSRSYRSYSLRMFQVWKLKVWNPQYQGYWCLMSGDVCNWGWMVKVNGFVCVCLPCSIRLLERKLMLSAHPCCLMTFISLRLGNYSNQICWG